MHSLFTLFWTFLGFGFVVMTLCGLFVYRVVVVLRRQRVVEMVYRERMAQYWHQVEAGGGA